jgi:hypothetical protein
VPSLGQRGWQTAHGSRLVEAVAVALYAAVRHRLGFGSPVEYLADVVATEMPSIARNVEQRRNVVALLTEHGMSQRQNSHRQLLVSSA